MSKNIKDLYEHSRLDFVSEDAQHRVCWNQKEKKCCDCKPHDNCLLPEEDAESRSFLEWLEIERLRKDNK